MNAALPPLIELSGVACGYDRHAVLADIEFSMDKGELVCLLGPNGVGKTTLFKTILRLLPPLAGIIKIGGENAAGWSARRFARMIGYVPQVHTLPFSFSVLDVVVMGRVAHLGTFAAPSRKDRSHAEMALEALSIGHLRDRIYTEISGGERQLVLVARALTQEPDLLVLDEPTSNLDYGNQVAVLGHIRRLASEYGIGVIMTTHDPNQALDYATAVVAIDRNRMLHVGKPAEIVSEAYLNETYGVRARIMRMKMDGETRRFCLPLQRGAVAAPFKDTQSCA
jgi:iron complex transport system ATP-binding protein